MATDIIYVFCKCERIDKLEREIFLLLWAYLEVVIWLLRENKGGRALHIWTRAFENNETVHRDTTFVRNSTCTRMLCRLVLGIFFFSLLLSCFFKYA